jgi:hypothetical protein
MTDPPIVEAMSESTAVNDVAAPVSISQVLPTPTDDEVVAIMAGVEALWPKPVVVVDAEPPRSTAWRFSGRWWSRPVPARRDRPYR